MILLSRLFLILTLIAGSVVMAPMRGAMAGVTQIEICAGDGVETLTLDAAGNPVAPRHPCPDCIACLAFGPLGATGGAGHATVAVSLTFPMQDGFGALRGMPLCPTARDPPRPV